MGIAYYSDQQLFHLQAKDCSYVFQVQKNQQLSHLYWGRSLHNPVDAVSLLTIEGRPFSTQLDPDDQGFTTEFLPQEYPAFGSGDFRQPAYEAEWSSGSRITELQYQGHEILAGKPKLPGLPAVYVESAEEADTLLVYLSDPDGLDVTLQYTVFANESVITRSALLRSTGDEPVVLKRVLSANVDFADSDFRMVQLSGAWGRERMVCERALSQGLQAVESARGASSHQQNPFLALQRLDADEHQGEVFGFSLVYSGNFLAQVEVDSFQQARVQLGINPRDFSWQLDPGEALQTPEVVMVHSAQGLNGLSQTYHRLYRTRLARGRFRDEPRPILINNWEATYFDFDEAKILTIAQQAQNLGVELFVLDDGWFGERDDDHTSLGDWFVDKKKLPNGLQGLAAKINDLGMKFGLWFEPEMISPVSQLYQQHPDWCIHVPGRRRTLSRNQLILNLARPDVQDYIIQAISEVLRSAPIEYVKWDMNRHMTEVFNPELPAHRQKETAHRYMLGLYRVLEVITGEFPHILFESCSGGGGRFDPGMLHYMPQTWTSDNTDAVERLKIQYGTSLVYPVSSMGAHVSAVPNHQTGRITSMAMRGHVNMFGNFGYELNLTELANEDLETIRQQVAEYKEIRQLVQQGTFIRLLSPFAGNETAWMVVSTDQEQAFFGYYRVLAEPNPRHYKVKLRGLDPNKRYRIVGTSWTLGGDQLMYGGLNVYKLARELQRHRGDFTSVALRLQSEAQ